MSVFVYFSQVSQVMLAPEAFFWGPVRFDLSLQFMVQYQMQGVMGGMRMFNIGDRVVYPMHGAGTIEGVEEKEILGRTHRYYVLRLPIGDMKVMIPVDNTEGIGLRDVISPSEVEKVMGVLRQECTAMSTNWNRRYRNNLEKIKSGDIYEVADVVRNLASREREKGLSTGERKMLDSAKEILVSELILAGDWNREEALNILEETLCDEA